MDNVISTTLKIRPAAQPCSGMQRNLFRLPMASIQRLFLSPEFELEVLALVTLVSGRGETWRIR